MAKYKEYPPYFHTIFFVTDCIEQHKDMDIKYCPMEDMLEDQFTKPQSGSLFPKNEKYGTRNKKTMIPSYNKDYNEFAKEQKAKIALV